MRERASLVDGRLEVEAAPGSGTTVRATIPFARGVDGTAAAAPYDATG